MFSCLKRPLMAVWLIGLSASVAVAGQPDKDLDDLSKIAGLGLMLCGTKAEGAKTYYLISKSLKKYEEVDSCVVEQMSTVEKYIEKLKPIVAPKPKAEAALKQFFVTWSSAILAVKYSDTASAIIEQMNRELETVRMELSW